MNLIVLSAIFTLLLSIILGVVTLLKYKSYIDSKFKGFKKIIFLVMFTPISIIVYFTIICERFGYYVFSTSHSFIKNLMSA